MIDTMRLCGYIWLAFYTIWLLSAVGTKRTAERADWGQLLSYTIPVALGYYCMFSSAVGFDWLQTRILPRNPELAVAAIMITLAGMAFAVWARVYLGRNWSSVPTIKEQHQLIRSGPYRLVRHPIYTGFLLAMTGTFLANGRIRGALSIVLLWIGWQVKTRFEEQFMVRAFGAQYEEYRRTTGALLPRIVG